MINTVLFDMGGTLEDIGHSRESELECGTRILRYLRKQGIDLNMSPDVFIQAADQGHRQYKSWADRTLRELMPYEIWSEWKLKGLDLDQRKLRAISEKISYIWEITYYQRKLRPDAKKLLETLRASGYRLGVISNTSSLTQVYKVLNEYGIKDYFEVITLSCMCGYKKPSPVLFEVTLAEINALPSETVYVGDTVSRDVMGARNAGLALSIRIDSEMTESSDYNLDAGTPDADYVVNNLFDIFDILEKVNLKLA